MGSKHRTYARNEVGGSPRLLEEVTRQEAMSRHAIASLTAFERWVKAYREGGPDAPRPSPLTPEEGWRPAGTEDPRMVELEAENRRLRAEVAYLKTI